MSLPTYLVFADVAFKFGVLNSLVLPMPMHVRKKYLKFLMTSPMVAKIVYALKIVCIFIAILFVDAFRTAYFVTLKPESLGYAAGVDGGDISASGSNTLEAKKLLAERNMNLSGSALFLSYLLWRVYELNMEAAKNAEAAALARGEEVDVPLDEHRKTFEHHYEKNKPDHKAELRQRALHNQEAPVPDHEDVKDVPSS